MKKTSINKPKVLILDVDGVKVLQQYDDRIRILKENEEEHKELLHEIRLKSMDKFMKECGNATDYTATISEYFTIPELFALKQFMYTHDTRRMIQMANQTYEETKLPQWKISEKWEKLFEIKQDANVAIEEKRSGKEINHCGVAL